MATTFSKKTNNGKSVITNNPLSIGATSVGITAGTESRFPMTGNFYATLYDATTYPDPSDDPNMEIVTATRSGTDTYTVSATVNVHAQGSAFRLLIVKAHFDEVETAIGELEATAAAAASPVVGEVPGGSVNGSNTAFTTASVFATGTLMVFKNGIRLKGGGADYTEAGGLQGFTMVTAPATGTVLLVNYFKTVNFATIGTNSLVEDETPTGTVNGSNTAFTVLKGSYIAGSLAVYLNGQKLTHTADFTETTPASGTFAFVTAPATGATVRVGYQFNQNAAGNADTIDGFHASSTPAANTILPLNGSGQFPMSILANFSDWASWTPGHNGFSVNPTATGKWMRIGNMAFVWYATTSAGTSNSTSFQITNLPVTPAATPNVMRHYTPSVTDNGSTFVGGILVTAGSTTLDIAKGQPPTSYTTWTNSGTKYLDGFMLMIPV